MWCDYRSSKHSYKVTSSRIKRLRPGTLKCSMQDRHNVHLCRHFSQFVYMNLLVFFCCFFLNTVILKDTALNYLSRLKIYFATTLQWHFKFPQDYSRVSLLLRVPPSANTMEKVCTSVTVISRYGRFGFPPKSSRLLEDNALAVRTNCHWELSLFWQLCATCSSSSCEWENDTRGSETSAMTSNRWNVNSGPTVPLNIKVI